MTAVGGQQKGASAEAPDPSPGHVLLDRIIDQIERLHYAVEALTERVDVLDARVFSTMTEAIPQPGQMWTRGISPGYAWKVCSISGGMVHLELYERGWDLDAMPEWDWRLADGFMDWPIDRWTRLVESERLELR